MFAILLAAVLAAGPAAPASTKTPLPSPTASPQPDVTAAATFNVDASWIPMPLQDTEYAAFARPEGGKPADLLYATKRKCDCQPADFASALAGDRKQDHGTTTGTSVQLCGQPATHVVSEGVADGIAKRNVEAYAFREGDFFYTMQLGFSGVKPTAADESSLTALCPPPA